MSVLTIPESIRLFIFLFCAITIIAEPQGNWRRLSWKDKHAKNKSPPPNPSMPVPIVTNSPTLGTNGNNASSNEMTHSGSASSPEASYNSTTQRPMLENTIHSSTSTTNDSRKANPQAPDSQNSGTLSEDTLNSPYNQQNSTTGKHDTIESEQFSVIPGSAKNHQEQNPSMSSQNTNSNSDDDYNVESDIVAETWSIYPNNKVDSSNSQMAFLNPIPLTVNTFPVSGSRQHAPPTNQAVTVATNTETIAFATFENNTVSSPTPATPANVENSSESPPTAIFENPAAFPPNGNQINASTLPPQDSAATTESSIGNSSANPDENLVVKISGQILTATPAATTKSLVSSTENPPILTNAEAVTAANPLTNTSTVMVTVAETTPKQTQTIASDIPEARSENKSGTILAKESKVKRKKNKHTAYYNRITALKERRQKDPSSNHPKTLPPKKLRKH